MEEQTGKEPNTNIEETNKNTSCDPISTTVATCTAGSGYCPVKTEYLRPAPSRETTDAEGRSRGMNKGSERAHVSIQGTERPSFEGEVNFLSGDVLRSVKAALREQKEGGKGKGRDGGSTSNPERSKREREGAAEAPPKQTNSSSPIAIVTEGDLGENKKEEGNSNVAAHTQANTEQQQQQQVVATTTTTAAAASSAKEEERMNDPSPSAKHSTDADMSSAHSSRQDRVELLKKKLRNALVLSPLTTVGNLPFRRICKGFGADVTFSEMALVFNLNNTQKSEWSLLRRHESEDFFGIQVACSRAPEAARFAHALEQSGYQYDFLDVNCGCPVDLMVKRGLGFGLAERKGRMREVVSSLAKWQSKPVTVKCRIGESEEDPTLHSQINEYESWGASAVTIHGRSRRQRYTKLANWEYINKCASFTKLPVIGNGDILSVDDIIEHRQFCPNISGGFMIGRGALIKPWVFQEIKENRTMDLSSHERFEILKKFCNFGLAHWGSDERGVQNTRRFLCEWLSFLCRYVPVGLLETLPQRINDRPPYFVGRDDLETLMSSQSVHDWIRITEMLLGPAGENFQFTPKHKSNSFTASSGGRGGGDGGTAAALGAAEDWEYN